MAETKKTVHRPDIEAVLRVEAREVCVIAFFKDTYGGYDVLVGVEDTNQRSILAAAFRQCASSLEDTECVILASDEDNPLPRNDR